METQKTKQDMIDKIYEVIADKELTMWCKLSYHNRGYLVEYTTYYKILSSHITIETWWSCNFPEWHQFIENIKDNEVWDMIIDEESKKYQRNRLRYLLEDQYNNLIYYNTNVKYEPKELINNTSHIYRDIDWYKIIWHPVMIWDVFQWFQDNKSLEYLNNDIMNTRDKIRQYLPAYWENKRKPIEDQSEECIEYIYNLLKE